MSGRSQYQPVDNKRVAPSINRYNVILLCILAVIGVITMGFVIAGWRKVSGIQTQSIQSTDNPESLKVLVETILAQAGAISDSNTAYQQWVELGRSKCRDDVGASALYNFSTYKKAELDAIIAFDVAGQSNIYFYPGISGTFPAAVTGPAPPYLSGNTLDPELYVKDVSITTALGFTLNITMLDTDFARDPRITLFLKNLRDRSYIIDSTGIKRNNMEKRRYMTALSMDVQMNRFLPKIDLLVEQVYNDITIYKRPILSSYDERLLTFFLSTHVGDRHYPEHVKSFFRNFSFIVSSWLPTEPKRNESILYNNANADCVIEFFHDAAVDILRTGDTTTLMYYWQAAGMSPETVVTEAMHNWIAYRQFMHITDLVVEHSMDPANIPRWGFSTGGYTFMDIWAMQPTESAKINTWREMMRVLLPNNAWFSRKPNANNDPASVAFQRAIHLPKLVQLAALGYNTTEYGTFKPSRYSPAFDTTLSEWVREPTTIANRKDYIMFNHTDTPAYLKEVMRNMSIAPADGQTLSHKGEEKMFPVFATPLYAPFGIGWRACAGQNMVTIYGVRFMERFNRLKFTKNVAITSPLIPQAPLKSVPDNLFVDQVALKN